MRWTRRVGGIAVAGAAALAAAVISCAQQQAPVAGQPQDPVARGKYLVTIMGCADCHTPGTLYGAPDTTRELAGSDLAWVGPWGVTYAPNLTPDSTGLAAWTAEDIVKAIRTGQRPDGSPILPPMPWPNFAFLTDEDAKAVAAYLKSRPAVAHRVPGRLPPGATAPSAIVFPAPPEWDARNLPPPPPAAASH